MLSSLGMTSCTADSIDDTTPALTTSAEDIGGQNGGLNPPLPPKP